MITLNRGIISSKSNVGPAIDHLNWGFNAAVGLNGWTSDPGVLPVNNAGMYSHNIGSVTVDPVGGVVRLFTERPSWFFGATSGFFLAKLLPPLPCTVEISMSISISGGTTNSALYRIFTANAHRSSQNYRTIANQHSTSGNNATASGRALLLVGNGGKFGYTESGHSLPIKWRYELNATSCRHLTNNDGNGWVERGVRDYGYGGWFSGPPDVFSVMTNVGWDRGPEAAITANIEYVKLV